MKGIYGISKVLLRELKENTETVNEEGEFVKDETNKWVLETDGTNLAGVLNMSQVDATKTISNHIFEIWEILGIEAVR
jgi:DNA-directed RNA polymerase beta' subunit